MAKKIIVEREPFEYNGRTCYRNVVKGTLYGRELRAQLVPQDAGGHVILDIIFGFDNEVVLIEKAMEIRNDKGKTEVFKSLAVQSADENGEVLECPVKPSRKTDKTKLDMLMRFDA